MLRRPPRSTLFPTRRSSDLPLLDRLHEERAHVQAHHERRRAPRRRRHELRRGRRLELGGAQHRRGLGDEDRKSTRLNSSHVEISYAVFCLKKKKKSQIQTSR